MSFIHYYEINKKPIDEKDYLKLHNKQLSKKILGLPKGGLILLSGLRGQGKSTFLGQLKLDLIDNGYKGLEFSLEMSNERVKRWTVLQACGKNNLKEEITSNGKKFYSPKSEYIENQIIEWIGDSLEIYDNGSFNAKTIQNQLTKRLNESNDIDFCIIDNMMRMDIAEYGTTKNNAQIKLIKTLVDICQKKNICLILVVHPAKTRGIPRLDDVSGASEICNLASLVFIIHKNNIDFRSRQKDVFHFNENNPIFQYNAILEIAKDRDFGQDDGLIGLYFEEESKRFLEEKGQMLRYGWDKRTKQQTLMDLAPIDNDDGQLPF